VGALGGGVFGDVCRMRGQARKRHVWFGEGTCADLWGRALERQEARVENGGEGRPPGGLIL
jgi:hypothetical protein